MEDFNCDILSKIKFLHPQNENLEKIDDFTLDVNESSIEDNNYSLKENNIINDKNLELFNYPEFINKKKDNGNNISSNNDKETLFNSQLNNYNLIDKNEIKRQLKLKRNRESAKKGRLRKKIYVENLINKIKELHEHNSNLLKIISKCPECKEKYKIENKQNNIPKNNYILNSDQPISNKKKFFIISAIMFISFINALNIFSINKPFTLIKRTRNLSIKEETEVLINKIKKPNGNEEALFLHLSEYYSLTTREKVVKNGDLATETNKNVKILNNNHFDIDNMNQTNVQNCVKCVVEIDKKSIKVGGDEITFYLVDRLLSKNFMNNLKDDIFPEIDFEGENKKSETYSKVLALKCKIIAYSVNNIYQHKIENIS